MWQMKNSIINTHENFSDMMTNLLPSEEKRWKILRKLLHQL